MTSRPQFFVLHRTGMAPLLSADAARRTLAGSRLAGGWHTRETPRLLIGWQGAAQADGPLLVSTGDLAAPTAAILQQPDFINDLATGHVTAADRLDGVFAVLAHDDNADQAALITDRFGLMPVYTCRANDVVGYSTSLEALCALMRPAVALDASSVSEMLIVHMVLGDRTLMRDVTLVPPASVVTLRGDQTESRRYWDWSRLESGRVPSRDPVGETYDLIEAAILRAVPTGVRKVGLPLSGGLDSRMIAAVLARHGVPIQAYNIDFGIEATIAREVSQVLKIPLRGLQILDRPETVPLGHRSVDAGYDVNQVWGWEMVRRAAEDDGCDVIFDGLAFDAILGTVPRAEGSDPASLLRNLENNYSDFSEQLLARLAGPEYARDTYARVHSSLGDVTREAIDRAGPWASDYFLMTNRVRKYTFGYCLANQHWLPGRYPYVTTRLFEHCLTLPLEHRIEHNLYRQIYRERFPALARIRWAKTGLALDKYGTGKSPMWRLNLDAALRRLTRGRITLSGRGSFAHGLRRDRRLRTVYETVLTTPTPEIQDVLPSELVARSLRGHMSGQNYGPMLQALYTVKHFWSLFGNASPTRQ